MNTAGPCSTTLQTATGLLAPLAGGDPARPAHLAHRFARQQQHPRAEALALASDKVQRQLNGASPRKVIVVPDRLVNIVA